MNGFLLRAPLVGGCSVRQYAYQDIGDLSKAGQRQFCLPRLVETTFLSRTQEERAVGAARVEARCRIQRHLTTGEPRNATISLHRASALPILAVLGGGAGEENRCAALPEMLVGVLPRNKSRTVGNEHHCDPFRIRVGLRQKDANLLISHPIILTGVPAIIRNDDPQLIGHA